MDTVENAIDLYRNLCKESGSVSLTIGGGEPTLHPKFFEILEKLIVVSALYTDDDDVSRPYIVSNGYDLSKARKLIKLACKNLIGLRFSVDNFHEELEHRDELMAWNTRDNSYYSDILYTITPNGRARENRVWTRTDMCCCDTLIIRPTGSLYFCGCLTKKLGNINSSYDIPEWYGSMQGDMECCSRNIRRFLKYRKGDM